MNHFWDKCDSWIDERLNSITDQKKGFSDEDFEKISCRVEENINSLIEKGLISHGGKFTATVLIDLHHLFFELELKKLGVSNKDQIHLFKENGNVGLSVAEGKITPDNALLVMELNRAHLKKKGGKNEGVCEDCICGKK